MGFFSWMFADTGRPMKISSQSDCWLLVPEKFGTDLHITSYDGYGHVCGYDAYDLLAQWNRNEPVSLLWASEHEKRRLMDYQAGKSVKYMMEHYGKDYLREIGIDMYFHASEELRYPLKFVETRVPYDSVGASEDDPLQGCD